MSERACDKTMNPRLYWAARRGDTSLLKLREIPDLDKQATTPTLNTALHIAVTYGKEKFVRELCSQCPSLLTQANDEGDTPLHIAARADHHENHGIAAFLVSQIRSGDIESAGAAEKLRMRNKNNYMPLHEAVRNDNLEVAKLLTEADPGWSCYDNDADNSLLNLAARTRNIDVVRLILQKPAAYGGHKGENALYVAAANSNFDIVELLVETNIQVIRGTDEHGKTPLHYAAEFGKHETVEKLISKYPSTVYKLDKKGHSPLHIAARKSQLKVVEKLIEHCPDCIEQRSQERESILHFAVKSKKLRMVIYVLDILHLGRLMNQPDMHGNTPFHVSATLTCSKTFFYLAFAERQNKLAVNNKQQTAFDIEEKQPHNTIFSKVSFLWVKFLGQLSWREWFKELGKEFDEQGSLKIESYKQMASTLATVATLTATVTFASALQVPGGFSGGDNPIPGIAALAGDPFFEEFMITDTIAMGLSLTAMFLILFGTYFDNKKFLIFFLTARILTFLSFLATGMAFMEGVAAVLPGGGLKNLLARGYGIAVWCPYIFAIFGFLIFVYPLMVPSILYVYQTTPHPIRHWVLRSKCTRFVWRFLRIFP